MQEGVGHIQLFEGPIEGQGKSENEVHGGWFNDWAQSLSLINAIPLLEVFGHKPGLIPV